MKRRTFDIMLSVGGFALAALLLVMGLVLSSNANFAKSYVKDQLGDQKITFKEKAALTEEEAKSDCLVKYAGQALTTGKQAECYANDFIGLHVSTIAKGETYASISTPMTALKTQIAGTKADDPALPGLQKQLADFTAQRETLFKGETLRGLLLTSFGFSVFGVKGDQVANVCYALFGLLLLLSLFGMVHAVKTPHHKTFALPDSKAVKAPEKITAGV